MQLRCISQGGLYANERAILLLPSATYSTSPSWDLEGFDASVVDGLVAQGWSVLLLDLPGYGPCDDPPHPERFGAERAAACVASALTQIEDLYGITQVSLMGWSWGAQVAGAVANANPELINRLILYGFNHSVRYSPSILSESPTREITREGPLGDFTEGCFDPDIRDAFASAVVASDDSAPAGPLLDFVENLPVVDAAGLEMPVLVVCGEYEVALPPGLDKIYEEAYEARRDDLEDFTNECGGSLVIIPGGGHAIHLEQPRAKWLGVILEFLESEA